MANHSSSDDRPVDFGFLLLASLFLASLVVCNLIANKFLTVDLGFKVFTLSAGSLPYPVTFLATDYAPLLAETVAAVVRRLVSPTCPVICQ